MQKSILVRVSALSLLLVAFQANAVIINGTNYKSYSGSSSTCPDGSKVFVYNNARYCKAYSASLSWKIPSTRTNGTALSATELKGYEVYWTRDSDGAKGVLKITSGTKSSTMFDVYTPGTYHFAVSAIDTAGLKSPLSTVAQASLGK